MGELLDEAEIKSDLREIEKLYLEKGYWNSNVDVEILQKEGDRSATVLFKIAENEKRKISKIIFVGNKNISSKKLLNEMETAPWRFWRFWSKRSKYRPSILEEDLNKLRIAYRDHGFLDVSINQSDVKINPQGSRNLDLIIKINEGIRSYFGDVTIVGNSVLTTDELLTLDSRKDRELKKGDPYSPTLLSEERTRLRKKYGEKGYLDARVISIRKPNTNTNQIDLRFEITENNKFSVNSIQVRGNDKTKTIAIVRELALHLRNF